MVQLSSVDCDVDSSGVGHEQSSQIYCLVCFFALQHGRQTKGQVDRQSLTSYLCPSDLERASCYLSAPCFDHWG